MLSVESLTKDYRTVRAVDDFSFVVQPGEIVALLGPNGAGKTTVLRCVAGIVQPTRGRITIAGQRLDQDEVAAKRALGFVPEVPNPYDLLTVREHLEFVARAFGARDELARRGDSLLERLSLTDKRDELVLTLSKGMKQKVMLACALVHHPPVLMLDEPMIGVDPRGQREVAALLREARAKGQALLVSTHVLATAADVCDRILILNGGRLVAEGTLAELREQTASAVDRSLEDVFLALTEEQPDHAPADLA